MLYFHKRKKVLRHIMIFVCAILSQKKESIAPYCNSTLYLFIGKFRGLDGIVKEIRSSLLLGYWRGDSAFWTCVRPLD